MCLWLELEKIALYCTWGILRAVPFLCLLSRTMEHTKGRLKASAGVSKSLQGPAPIDLSCSLIFNSSVTMQSA